MNQKNPIYINSDTKPPTYRPPPEIEELLNSQGALRRRTVKLPKRNWIQRNPRIFHVCVISVSLLTFFSKPLYDLYYEYQIKNTISEFEKKNASSTIDSSHATK